VTFILATCPSEPVEHPPACLLTAETLGPLEQLHPVPHPGRWMLGGAQEDEAPLRAAEAA
jgi:hypothetical protein